MGFDPVLTGESEFTDMESGIVIRRVPCKAWTVHVGNWQPFHSYSFARCSEWAERYVESRQPSASGDPLSP